MLFFSIVAFYFAVVYSRDVPAPVSTVVVPYYIGHWKQIYQAPTNILFQGYGTCITADYSVLDNGNISVLNSQLDEHHKLEQIGGYGYYTNISEPGKLTVHLDGVPVDSPYWIIQLGEVVDKQYSYTIITTPSYISLWVLARNITAFFELYDKEVVAFLQQYNFKYTVVSQTDCAYTINNRWTL